MKVTVEYLKVLLRFIDGVSSGPAIETGKKLLRFKKLLLKVMLLFNKGAAEAFFMVMQLADEQGKIQSFGPYTQDVVSIPGKSILGSRPEGDYRVKW
jgi:hypothetical protein